MEKKIFYTVNSIPSEWPIQKVLQFFLDIFNLLGMKIYPADPVADTFIEKYGEALEKGEE